MVLRDVGGPLGVERLTPSPHTSITGRHCPRSTAVWFRSGGFAGANYVVKDRTLGQGKVAE